MLFLALRLEDQEFDNLSRIMSAITKPTVLFEGNNMDSMSTPECPETLKAEITKKKHGPIIPISRKMMLDRLHRRGKQQVQKEWAQQLFSSQPHNFLKLNP